MQKYKIVAFPPHTSGVRNTRPECSFPTEPFSPNGLLRGRDGSPLAVTVAGVGRPLGLPGMVAMDSTEAFRRP